VDLGIAGRGRVEVSVVLLPKPGFDQLGRDRREAVGRRCENVGRPHRFEQVGRGVAVARDRRYFRGSSGTVRARDQNVSTTFSRAVSPNVTSCCSVTNEAASATRRSRSSRVIGTRRRRRFSNRRERFGHRPHRGVVLPGRGGVVD